MEADVEMRKWTFEDEGGRGKMRRNQEFELVVHGIGGAYWLGRRGAGYGLWFDAYGHKPAAYGHVYATEQEARADAHSFAQP